MLDRLEQFFQRDLWVNDLEARPLHQQVGIHALRLTIAVGSEFRHRLLDARAASLVYTTLLSLVPFLAVMFSVLKAFGVHEQIEPVLGQALQPLGEKGEELTAQIIGFVSNLKVGVLGAVGVAALFFTTYSLIDKIEEALNTIWQVRQGRPLARKFTDYLSVVLVGPVLVFTAFALIASAQSHWLVQFILGIQPVGELVGWGAKFTPFLLLCGIFTFCYKFVPNTSVRLTSALVGGITTAVLWNAAGAAFSSFVAASTRYSAIYSSFAILILFFLWLYVCWVIVLIGSQVAFFHQHPSAYQAHRLWRRGSQASREWLSLTLLLHVTRRYLRGEPPYRPVALASDVGAPLPVVEELLEEFVRCSILGRIAQPEGISLVKPPEMVLMTDVMGVLRCEDVIGLQPSSQAKDPVATLLRRRDQAVARAFAGITLRTFATEAGPLAQHGGIPAQVVEESMS